MKPDIWLTSSCALLLILTGCTQKAPDIGPGTGPYDSAGNYREDWADDPSKWRKPGKSVPSDDLPVIAKNEEPPANSNPLVPQAASNPKPTSTRVESAPRETVKRSDEPKEVAAKPKPKTTVVKTKPKPKTTRYTVKNGDSLSKIASRTGASVSAIQRANGISGTLIRPGQSLVIPKR